jgi:hypothetical protein
MRFAVTLSYRSHLYNVACDLVVRLHTVTMAAASSSLGVDPFKLQKVRFQYAGYKPCNVAVTGILGITLMACTDKEFDAVVSSARDAMHKHLPKRIKPETSGPQKLRSFEAKSVKGEWIVFQNVDPLTELWEKDFEERRTNSTHKASFFHRTDGCYTAYLRPLQPKPQRKDGRKTKRHARQQALSLLASCDEDVREVEKLLNNVRFDRMHRTRTCYSCLTSGLTRVNARNNAHVVDAIHELSRN